MNNNKTLGIILARAGSKRLKNKNLRKIKKKNLIEIASNEAIRSKIFDKIIIFTNIKKNKIKIFNKDKNLISVIKRERAYSTEKVSSENTLLHLFKKKPDLKIYKNFILLQPTSPMRTFDHIKSSYKKFLKKNKKSLVSIVHGEDIKKQNNFMINNKKYKTNGAIYICKLSFFLKFKKLFSKKSETYIMSKKTSIDIDYKKDLELAKKLL